MPYVLAAPEALAAAASDIAGIGSTLSSAHAAAAAPTTGLMAAAADEVSTQIAALFSAHGQGFQRLGAQAAAFHAQFVQALATAANQYATVEAGAAQTLLNTVNASVEKVLGHPLIGDGSGSGARAGIGGLGFGVFGGGAARSLGATAALALQPTGGASALAAVSPLLRAAGITNAAAAISNAVAAPAAFEGIATAIENLYNFAEPWVQWGFSVAAWAVGWVPFIGILGPQINFFYNLFEPMVQSGLFNILDWLTGSISFSQGLANFWAATTSSINAFIQTEINWFLSFLPPFPPFNLPPLPPLP